MTMPRSTLAILLLACASAAPGRAAETLLIDGGRPKATIIIAERPPRMAALAALELQHYLEKISGARLPIAHEPREGLPVRVYVGKSRFTDALGIDDEGLEHGAFRMVGGLEWLALVGRDSDYAPPEPFAAPMSREQRLAAWDGMTAQFTTSKWAGPPVSDRAWGRGNFQTLLAKRYGAENGAIIDSLGGSLRFCDRGGSFNAVSRYLMSLGVRWYMPGPRGEVIPKRRTIGLAAIDRIVRPDYQLRTFNWSGYDGQPLDNILWAQHVGMNAHADVWPFTWAHNLTVVFDRAETKTAHPEYFALRGGKREIGSRGVGNVCYSSEGLAKEAVAYARFVFDRFDLPAVDLWPEDGYAHCNCELCRTKTPSEAVWGFVDKVARELLVSHPDRLVTCASYTPYNLPPETVERFSPNVAVMIASASDHTLDQPGPWSAYLAKVEQWRAKTAPGNLLRWQNATYNSYSPLSFPVIYPRAIAAELAALRGKSKGEFHNWQAKPVFHNPGCSHLSLYTKAQYLWDGGQDIDAFLEEYYTLFYGPARDEMKTALEYAQQHYNRDARGPAAVSALVKSRFVELVRAARRRAGDTVYGERIQLLLDELPALEALQVQAKAEADAPDPRKDAALIVGHDGPEKAQPLLLKHLVTGEEPEIATSCKLWWQDEKLCLEVCCDEPDMKNLFASSLVYDGDSVVVLLETQAFSYYHLEIGPDGRIFERAVNPPPEISSWTAQAEVETTQGDKQWKVLVRLPNSGADGMTSDPLHRVAGTRPSDTSPWFINIGRSRVRGDAAVHYAVSPTGRGTYHEPGRFAKLVIRP